VKYETEKKEKQIAALANEKEIQEHETMRQSFLKVLFMSGSVVLVILFLLVFFLLRQRLRNQKILAVKNEEIKAGQFKQQLSELELKALRAQINPHFIFNCLNSINQMILDGENQKASKYLSKFGKLIRLILENAEETEVVLKDELLMLETYIQLEMLRFGGAIDYSVTVEDDVDAENTYLPAMVLQPFVENAVWHGLIPKKDSATGRIAITIKRKDDLLLCVIEDNGIGREKALELQQKTVYKSKSLGLKITEERLRLLNREMQRQWIRFVDLKDPIGFAIGTRVEVSIPIS
jgi:sensor histidine kinase YesM